MTHRKIRKLISFQLTEDWVAWYREKDGSFSSVKVDALGLAKVWVERTISGTDFSGDSFHRIEREYSHEEIVGLMFSHLGETEIAEEDNFECLTRIGEKPNSVEDFD